MRQANIHRVSVNVVPSGTAAALIFGTNLLYHQAEQRVTTSCDSIAHGMRYACIALPSISHRLTLGLRDTARATEHFGNGKQYALLYIVTERERARAIEREP